MEVGIVGKPNVGKSTFFKALTLADVEIANFPFTTIKPNTGIGYVRSECACREFNVNCNPKNSYCRSKNRFTPIKLIDVAGLVPGAHEGKGLGNQFMDDLRQADALIHIVDISGTTDSKGEPIKDYDPEQDIIFLEEEINLWFADVIKRNWAKISNKIQYEKKDLIKELTTQLSGLQISEFQIKNALNETNLSEKTNWDSDDIKKFAFSLRRISKSIIIAANKIDLDKGNYERLKSKYNILPVCAEAELALRQAASAELIEYLPGDSDFKILKEMDQKKLKALEFIRSNILTRYSSTGVQKCLNSVVFDVLGQIVVYPVENENKLTDSKNNVLPDSYLVTKGSTALDLAYKVHTDLGDKFIGAIDCKTKRKVGKDYKLNNKDVIKIISGR